jgi:hypothetical protein
MAGVMRVYFIITDNSSALKNKNILGVTKSSCGNIAIEGD